jgi:uncharacterized membrane protein YgcG
LIEQELKRANDLLAPSALRPRYDGFCEALTEACRPTPFFEAHPTYIEIELSAPNSVRLAEWFGTAAAATAASRRAASLAAAAPLCPHETFGRRLYRVCVYRSPWCETKLRKFCETLFLTHGLCTVIYPRAFGTLTRPSPPSPPSPPPTTTSATSPVSPLPVDARSSPLSLSSPSPSPSPSSVTAVRPRKRQSQRVKNSFFLGVMAAPPPAPSLSTATAADVKCASEGDGGGISSSGGQRSSSPTGGGGQRSSSPTGGGGDGDDDAEQKPMTGDGELDGRSATPQAFDLAREAERFEKIALEQMAGGVGNGGGAAPAKSAKWPGCRVAFRHHTRDQIGSHVALFGVVGGPHASARTLSPSTASPPSPSSSLSTMLQPATDSSHLSRP